MAGLFGRFYGRREVTRRRVKMQRTGKVTAATLQVRGGSSVNYLYCYRWPQPQNTGIGGSGYPNTQGQVTLFREGEATGPVVDDKLTIGSTSYQVIQVTAENNADEADGYAVYQLVTV
jgi:hypothetical protein